MKLFFRPITILSIPVAVAVSGCGITADQLRREVVRLENDIGDLRNIQAEQSAQLGALRAELRSITGRIEEAEHSQKTELGSNIANLREDISSLKRRVPPPAIVPANTLTADEDFAESLGSSATEFAAALSRIRDGRFRDAVTLLQTAQGSAVGQEWGALVYFWLGVAYDGVNDLKSALQAYHAVRTEFPKHKRVPLALLRQGSVFVRLGDAAAAKLTWNKLISEHGKSEEANIARERIKGIK